MDDFLGRLWDRIAAAMAAEAQADLVPPHPPANDADIDAALARWRDRRTGPTRDKVIDMLLDRKLRLQKDEP